MSPVQAQELEREIAALRARLQDDAFGAIGPQAKEALPVLEELAKGVRVRWNAEAAIKKVKGGSGAR